MRIVSGERKGLKLYSPLKSSKARPSSDKLKESLFNIISPIKVGAEVLDLFGGSGQIGLEFLSRGAGFLYLCEKDKGMISLIEKNIEKASYKDKSFLYKGDFRLCLKKLNRKFDYIFLDPPYNFKMDDIAIKSIIERELLKKGGLLILESSIDKQIFDMPAAYNIIFERAYGHSKIIIFTKMAEN